MRRARARRRRASRRDRRAEWYDLARRLTPAVFALLGGVATLLYYGLRLESGWAESLSSGASVAFLTFLALEIPNMVFADMFVRSARAEARAEVQGARAEVQGARAEVQGARAEVQGARAEAQSARAERDAAKALLAATEARAIAAEANVKHAEARAEATEARVEATEARAEATEARAEAAQRRSDRMALVFIEALRDRDSIIDVDALRRLFELEE